MQDKLSQIRRLLRDGYVLEDVESDHHGVHATLRRGARIVLVRLGRADAEQLLYGGPAPLVWFQR